jgi:hypothetical protein
MCFLGEDKLLTPQISTSTFSMYTHQYFLPSYSIVTTVATLSTTGFVVPSCFAASETVIMQSGKNQYYACNQ